MLNMTSTYVSSPNTGVCMFLSTTASMYFERLSAKFNNVDKEFSYLLIDAQTQQKHDF